MPEGPEIRRMAFCLNERLKDLTCEFVFINRKNKFHKDGKFHKSPFNFIKIDENFSYINLARTCINISSYGKKIIFDFDDILMISSCGMDGNWGFREKNFSGLMLRFQNGNDVFYDDSSRKGNFSVVYKGSEEHIYVMKDVGPDLSFDSTNYEIFKSAITNKRIKNKPLCEFLMEQERLSGIGNYLRAEIMYLSRIDPMRKLSSLDESNLEILFGVTKFLLNESYQKNGLTIATYEDPYGIQGTYETYCYMKNFDKNGFKIETFKDSKGRTVHWCKETQN